MTGSRGRTDPTSIAPVDEPATADDLFTGDERGHFFERPAHATPAKAVPQAEDKHYHGHRERLDRNRRRPVRVMPQDRLDQPLGRAAVRQIHEELAHGFFRASAMARTAAQALSSSLPSNSR